MIFSQLEYLFFFSFVFVSYWLSPRQFKVPLLLIASLLFYASWNFRYLGLILFSAGVDFFVARRIEGETRQSRRNALLWVSLVTNLGVLGLFKYYGFFSQSVADLLGSLGVAAHLPTLNLLLPVGISFYTFQSMSYTIDVWRGQRPAETSLVHFTTYVAFFPQLVAGPIVRVSELMPQLKSPPNFCVSKFKRGGKLFFWGLIKKNIFADLVAVKCVDVVFSNPSQFDGATLLLGALAYSLQIYADFSGYTDMARGSALMLGFELPENFRTPYLSRSLTEFWRRWHISLSFWLRDYLYIALGGNRGSTGKTYRNLMYTMLLGGLWHGAAWTFVIWGALHGGGLMAHRWWSSRTQNHEVLGRLRTTKWYNAFAMFATFIFVCLCFVIFRTTTLGHAIDYLQGLMTFQDGIRQLHPVALGLIFIFGAGTVLGQRVEIEKIYERTPWWLRSAAYCVAFLALLVMTPQSAVPFVYFQF